MDASGHQVLGLLAEAAQGAAQRQLGWHDVRRVGAPADDVSDADHGGLQGGDVARDDRLQGHDVGGLRHHQVRRQVRALAAVAADAREDDLEDPAAGHDRPGAGGDHPYGQPRSGVQGVDGVAREALEQAVFEHRGRSAQALLRGLEDDVHHAPEVAVSGQPSIPLCTSRLIGLTGVPMP